jgi:hypothetical protein
MTSTQFDAETSARLDAIRANPNPHAAGFIKRSIAWGKALDREAALDSAKSVFAVVGVGAAVAYMGTMPPYLVPLALALFGFAWYADYRRHF